MPLELSQIQFEVFGERGSANFHIMNMGTHFVHSISWWMYYDVIFSGITKGPVKKINALVASISEEYIFRRKPLDFGQPFFYFNLVRIRIPVICRGYG